ncbi:MAG: stage II sporulation protein P [Agathobacter sp.]|nr:stage II sporulation protein P [Agathobacter sp.]
MRKNLLIIIVCSFLCVTAYCWSDLKWENAKSSAVEYLYLEVSKQMTPYLHTYEEDQQKMIYTDVKRFFAPLVWEFHITNYQAMTKEEVVQEDTITDKRPNTSEKPQKEEDEIVDVDSPAISTGVTLPEKKVVINRLKLQEFDYLRQNFYQVDNTTTIGSDQLDVNKLLEKDLKIKTNVKGPQILIYHTHSQEGYKDSIPGDPSMSIVGVGDYLENLLETKYGVEVLHHKGKYDLPSRDNAYSNALPNIVEILQQNPSIEVVIDLHRDGVPENRHFVTEINGKPTAKIMFFNGLSRTTSQGELSYLPNPYIADNLAFSFQMQLAAAEYFPDFTRKIYLKGYRYNLHLRPKSVLVEVGAQTNSFEEAKNAMEPLAELLSYVLIGNSKE